MNGAFRPGRGARDGGVSVRCEGAEVSDDTDTCVRNDLSEASDRNEASLEEFPDIGECSLEGDGVTASTSKSCEYRLRGGSGFEPGLEFVEDSWMYEGEEALLPSRGRRKFIAAKALNVGSGDEFPMDFGAFALSLVGASFEGPVFRSGGKLTSSSCDIGR